MLRSMKRMADASYSEADAVREAEAVRAARAARDAALTPSERLERAHEICRQLSAIRLVSPSEQADRADLERLTEAPADES